MFLLIMQFLWKYIDDLMGKGLSVGVILELLFYVSATLIPLALPLAILLSSIMTLGNLSEHNELTALKSSGLSLYRILRPLIFVTLLIGLGAFYFANYVIPVANLKWHSLIFDIQQKKIATILTPGSFNNELDGYSIKIDEGTDDTFKNILILDHTNPTSTKTIRAEDGKIYKSTSGKYLFFELNNGYAMEELSTLPPNFTPDGKLHGAVNTRPAQRTKFEKATYKIDLTGFDLNRSNAELFKDRYEMLNVFQIKHALDSIQKNATSVLDNFGKNIKNDHPYYLAHSYKQNSEVNGDSLKILPGTVPDTLITYKGLSKEEKIKAINLAQSRIRNKTNNLDNQARFMETMERDIKKYLIEANRKFALAVAIIILFFVGAPLGAIVRRGGFGAPVVIAALLFMVYFVLMTIGENLALNKTLSPYLGMWLPSIILAPIAFWLMRSAANDSPVFSKDAWLKFFRLKK